MEIFSLICIIIAIIFINYSMYRGLSLPLACTIGAIFIFITSGIDVQTGYEEAMDSQVLTMMKTYAPLFLFGGVLGMFYSESGATTSLGKAILAPTKKVRNPVLRLALTFTMFYVLRTLITLTGIDGMACMPTICALTISAFKELNVNRRYLNAVLQCGGTLSMFVPFAPGGANILLPMFIDGFTASTAWGARLIFLFIFMAGSIIWLTHLVYRDWKKGGGFEMGNIQSLPLNESEHRPHWLVTLIPIAVIPVLYNVFGMSAWLSLAVATLIAAILFYRYIPIPEGKKRLGVVVEKCNQSGVMVSLLLLFSYLPGVAITMSPAYELVTGFASGLAGTLPLAVGLGILAIVLVVMGNSATVVLCNLASSIFIPAGLSMPTAGLLIIVCGTVFDTLPNSPFIAAQAQLLDSPMHESYPPIFKTTVLLTTAMSVLAILMAVVGVI